MTECPICYNNISNAIFISHCFHIFCLNCIKKALFIKKACPLCRKKLYYNPERPNNNIRIVKRTYNRLFMENFNNGYRWMESYTDTGEIVSSSPLWINSIMD